MNGEAVTRFDSPFRALVGSGGTDRRREKRKSNEKRRQAENSGHGV